MSKLTFRDIHVRYFGYDEAVIGFSASFSTGWNVIFGAQGSGKTTLLKALSGLIESSGEVDYDGEDYRSVPLKDRDFQLVFDDLALFSRRSVRYNLEYPLKKRGFSKNEIRERVYAAAEKFGLDVMIDAPVYRLTEWHKVALALCRVYIRKAKVTFIDNVFSCLDEVSRRQAFLTFTPLLSECGILIFATDSISEAASLSDTIFYLSAGYLLQEGSIRDFMNKPASVSTFLNFFEYPSVLSCRVEKGGVSALGRVVSFDNSALISSSYVGSEALVGLLPRDFSLTDRGETGRIIGFFHSSEGIISVVQTENARLYALIGNTFCVGDEVVLGFSYPRFLFDRISERSIVRYQDA